MLIFFYYFNKTITVLAFSSVKGFTQTYLVKISIMHNKYLTPRLKEDNVPISAKCAAKISSFNLEYTFLYFKILISCLCNSRVNYLFTFASSLLVAIVPDTIFLSKNLYTILINAICYPSYC